MKNPYSKYLKTLTKSDSLFISCYGTGTGARVTVSDGFTALDVSLACYDNFARTLAPSFVPVEVGRHYSRRGKNSELPQVNDSNYKINEAANQIFNSADKKADIMPLILQGSTFSSRLFSCPDTKTIIAIQDKYIDGAIEFIQPDCWTCAGTAVGAVVGHGANDERVSILPVRIGVYEDLPEMLINFSRQLKGE